MRHLRRWCGRVIPLLATLAAACVAAAHLPTLPVSATIALPADDSAAVLATRLAPTLYVQRDEPFRLLRVAAVVHPTKSVIAYHLLWEHDVNLQWVPWAKPSDEEIVWVGYDPRSGAATDLWTYWHGAVLHADWRAAGDPAIDVQWGKHGSLPHRTIESDLRGFRKLNAFYVGEFILLPDIWLGKLAHGGPWGFFHGYARYRDYSDTVRLSNRLDAVLRGEDVRDGLHAVFGPRYSNKVSWPWRVGGSEP